MNDMVFRFAPSQVPGIRDVEVLSTTILKQNGFAIQENLAGIPTAWMATWGSGKPVIALGSDIDDIPQASQKPGVAWHEPIIEGGTWPRRRTQLRHAAPDRGRARGSRKSWNSSTCRAR